MEFGVSKERKDREFYVDFKKANFLWQNASKSKIVSFRDKFL
jgi:hypothetical protein